MLPDDWRLRMADMIRGAAPPEPAWFAGGPALGPAEQLAVYQEQFVLRMRATLRENFAGLGALLQGDAEPLFDAYVADHPPRSWTLEHVGEQLPDWLAERGAPPEQVEMARVDIAISRGFVAANAAPLRPEDLGAAPALRRAPSVTLLRLGHSVHRFRGQFLAGETPDPLLHGEFWVAIYRLDRRMRHLELPQAAWLLLDRVETGLESAISSLLDEGVPLQELQEGIPAWFRLFAERALLVRAGTPPA